MTSSKPTTRFLSHRRELKFNSPLLSPLCLRCSAQEGQSNLRNSHPKSVRMRCRARSEQSSLVVRLCGTKLGCGEGGCGACTVMVSRYDRGKKQVVARHHAIASSTLALSQHLLRSQGWTSCYRVIHTGPQSTPVAFSGLDIMLSRHTH
uniref:2Fe-2S ferredoxin-type domain-containing protein n=1 Tax=Timema douglasi TaxID=61478 RepID=A0A7R8ZEF4_TIMDO|nr:unnamed protein product [Timema douglasi]